MIYIQHYRMSKRLRVVRACLLGFFLLSMPMSAQQLIQIPYNCGFEDVAENDQWVLNYGPDSANCAEKWMVGNAARSEGRSGLYISNDGFSAAFGANANVVIAYREFSVPTRIPYDISFDWKSMGRQGESDLYVLLLRESDAIPVSNASSGMAGNDILSNRRFRLSNSSRWQNESFQETLQPNERYRLVFAWVNNNRDTTNVGMSGACIDNIQIVSTKCRKPDRLTVDASCDTTFISWSGSSEQYELEYKSMSDMRWSKLGVISERKYELFGLAEGSYAFRVRGICDADTSAYVTANAVSVFCPEEHCINYVALGDNNVVQAMIGTASNQFQIQQLVDYGSDDIRSRHTVNWIPDEFDPRTGNRLRTIPENEVASVRLGNWDNGNEGEGLVFPYLVDPDMSLLLLRYAVVLQDPEHNEAAQPGFLLEITDASGTPIDPTCGRAEFYADHTAEGWHVVGSGSNMVVWKDWTTVGLDLSPYAGKLLYIRLSTWDCTMGAHYGYAYFTLNCASATIRTNSCGDNPVATIEAPEGFVYEWYNPHYPDSLWTTPSIEIPATDTTTYYCDVRYMEDTTCGFTLSTQAYPRFPIADFEYEYVVNNCQNIIRMKNKSHIMTMYDGNIEHTDEPCEQYFWEVRDADGKVLANSSKTNPEFVCPNEGGMFDVFLSAYIAERQCSADTFLTVTLPAIGTKYDTLRVEICQNRLPYIFGEMYIMQGGSYCDTVPSLLTGCDSITTLELVVHDQYDMPVVVDTICFGDTYSFAGKTYDRTTKDEVWLKSVYGCDSVVSLDLYVRDEVTFDAVPTDVLEGPNSGRIDLQNVSVSDYTYSLNGVMNAPLVGLAGGEYTVVVYNEFGCASNPQTVNINQDCLEIEFGEVPAVCGDEPNFSLDYTIGKGFATTYDVLFDNRAKEAGFTDMVGVVADGAVLQVPLPAGVRPGYYTMTLLFEDLLCDTIVHSVDFTVLYPSTVLAQKWNDVIAIRNADNNGGYEFTAFQWYKDGVPIDGETGSYLYIRDGQLDTTSEYAVLLTRADDGEAIFTCSLIPEKRAETDLYPTVVQTGMPVTIDLTETSTVMVYDALGLCQRVVNLTAGGGLRLEIADTPGYYFVHVSQENGNSHLFKVAVVE